MTCFKYISTLILLAILPLSNSLYASPFASSFSSSLTPISNTTNSNTINNTTIIGKVFYDLNGDGIQNANESGLPSVRLATVTGLLIETDAYGRFHITADEKSQSIEQAIIVKLDHSSLPEGALITSENPRVIRHSQGIMTKVNFAIQ